MILKDSTDSLSSSKAFQSDIVYGEKESNKHVLHSGLGAAISRYVQKEVHLVKILLLITW